MTDTTPEAEWIWLWRDGDRRCVSTPIEPYPSDAVKYIREDNLLARIKELEDRVAQLQWDVLRLEARLND